MSKRDFETESIIRDSKLFKIELQFDHYSEFNSIKPAIKISFIKFEKDLIELSLLKPSKIDVFEDDFAGNYVSHFKVIKENDVIRFCFDPYDERINEIQDEDNYIFECKDFEIKTESIIGSKRK